MITLQQALIFLLRDRGQAVVTDYGLFLLISQLFALRVYEDERINIRLDRPDLGHLRRLQSALFAASILSHDNDLLTTAHRVLIVPDEPAAHIVCETDPLAYLSHLSAMQHHGLTDRNPAGISLARPARKHWRGMLLDHLEATGAQIPASEGRRLLQRPPFPAQIRGQTVAVHEMSEPGAWVALKDSPLRVATIGQTFIDTISHPAWCGGMAHVLDVWEEHAPVFLDEIIDATEKTDRKIVKVRAGYILQERLGITDGRVEVWTRFAQRGGSQLLDASRPYTVGQTPKFSDKWMISINV
jgi:predicted transcriptional regulator of viral defense system